MEQLFRRVAEFIDANNLIEQGDKVLLALSGGPDSMFMYRFFLWYFKESGIDISTAYINHNLRKDSENELFLVKKIAKRDAVPFYYRNIKIEGITGIEEKARDKRYSALCKIANQHRCTKIATGHTLDDQAETVIMRFLRGSGLAGMRGILPLNRLSGSEHQAIIRPLLCLQKEEIVGALDKNGIKYCTDHTNFSKKFFRNVVRQEVLPLLLSYNPKLKVQLFKRSSLIQDDFNFIKFTAQREIDTILANGMIDCSYYRQLNISVKRMAAALLIERVTGNPYRSFKTIVNVMRIIDESKDIYMELSRLKDMIINIKTMPEGAKIFKKTLNIPGKTYITKDLIVESGFIEPSKNIFKNTDRSTGYFDADISGKKIKVRSRKKGDMFQPLGMKNRKKLSRFFIDRRVPCKKRDRIPIFDVKGTIIWVGGIEISEEFKVSASTQKILRLKIVNK